MTGNNVIIEELFYQFFNCSILIGAATIIVCLCYVIFQKSAHLIVLEVAPHAIKALFHFIFLWLVYKTKYLSAMAANNDFVSLFAVIFSLCSLLSNFINIVYCVARYRRESKQSQGHSITK